MTIEDQIRDEKLQHDINREAAKISALSLRKIDKYEYLTGEEILPSNQQQIIEKAKFTYSPLEKAFEKQTKTIKDQGKKQVDALESLKPSDKQLTSIRDFISKERLNSEIANKIERTEEEERKTDGSKMVYKASNETYDFRKFKIIRVFGNEIRNNNIIDMSMANDEQDQLLGYINKIKSKTKPHNLESKKVKEHVLNSARALLKGREMVFKAFESGIFLQPEELKKGTGLKVLTPKQMLQRLPIALAQIKACNNSKSLLNEIRQVVYSLYQSKEITKKVYNNIIKSIKV